jgi:hypothetical protein
MSQIETAAPEGNLAATVGLERTGDLNIAKVQPRRPQLKPALRLIAGGRPSKQPHTPAATATVAAVGIFDGLTVALILHKSHAGTLPDGVLLALLDNAGLRQ